MLAALLFMSGCAAQDAEKKSGIIVTDTPAGDHLPIYTKVNFK